MASRNILISSLKSANTIKSVRSITTKPFLYSADKSGEIEKVTHTGQVFDAKDYRNARFTNAARIVNDNWGIKLIAEVPPKECTERVIYCDGGDGPLGHPKVYINLDKPGSHACGYCGLRFVKKDDHH